MAAFSFQSFELEHNRQCLGLISGRHVKQPNNLALPVVLDLDASLQAPQQSPRRVQVLDQHCMERSRLRQRYYVRWRRRLANQGPAVLNLVDLRRPVFGRHRTFQSLSRCDLV